jgi:cysteine desulfurase
MKLPIYLDSHATTPTDPRVLDRMLPYFTERFGNPSSRNHQYGWQAEEAVATARREFAALVGANAKEIVFTSGATEADNLAIRGAAALARPRGDHIVTTAIEHRAVLDACRRLEGDGFRVTYLPVQPDGRVDVEALRDAITDRTILVSVMAANNEIGTLQPLAEIGRLTRERGILFHTDAAQACGKVPFDVEALNLDLASFAGHKMYAPKGVGALYVRRRPRVELAPLVDGGGQEGGIRPGTLNVPGIVGLGAAAELCRQELPAEGARLAGLRDRLRAGLQERLADVHVNGSVVHRLPHNLNVSVDGVAGDALLVAIDDIAVSSGAACTTGKKAPSYVLKAIGLSDERADASLRFGLCRNTTREEIDYAIDRIAGIVTGLRRRTPVAGPRA